jgi:hypothetical protein
MRREQAVVEQHAAYTLQPFLEERKRHVVDLLPGGILAPNRGGGGDR